MAERNADPWGPTRRFMEALNELRAEEQEPMHPYPCALCGRKPATGFASVNGKFYCHGDFDPEPTCYMRAQAR